MRVIVKRRECGLPMLSVRYKLSNFQNNSGPENLEFFLYKIVANSNSEESANIIFNVLLRWENLEGPKLKSEQEHQMEPLTLLLPKRLY